MTKFNRGRAGRETKRAELLTEYGSTLAQMLANQIKPKPDARVLHIGSPGATHFAEIIAPRLVTSDLVICVYTFDELEETRAALAGLGNVHVINDLEDLDEDEPPFDIVSCIAPYPLGREAVIELIEQGVACMALTGTCYVAGDRQHELDRYTEALGRLARTVQQLADRGQYRVVSISGEDLRRAGAVSGRRN